MLSMAAGGSVYKFEILKKVNSIDMLKEVTHCKRLDGFLVRTSTHKPGVYMLYMVAGGNVYNSEKGNVD